MSIHNEYRAQSVRYLVFYSPFHGPPFRKSIDRVGKRFYYQIVCGKIFLNRRGRRIEYEIQRDAV